MAIISFFNKIFITLSVIAASVAAVLPGAATTYSPSDASRVQMTAVLIADMHTDGNFFRDRNDTLRVGFSHINHSSRKADALVMAGDITNSAAHIEYSVLKAMTSTYLHGNNILPAMGNHDARGTSIDEDFVEANRYFRNYAKFCGKKIEHSYYAASVNGYPFFIMGTEQLLQNQAYFSAAQLNWLDAGLEKCSKSGKPVFVVCHQPLNGIYGAETNGETSQAFENVLRKYADNGLKIILISGHCHRAFGTDNFKTISTNLYQLNLPSFLYYTEENADIGCGAGYMLECYADKVLLRARFFGSEEWFENLVFEIPLT